MPPQKPVGVASATKPNILGSLSNSPDTQVGGKEKVWGTWRWDSSTVVGQAISSTGTEEYDVVGNAWTTITRLEGEDSDGGVEGCQDDIEDADGDRTDSSNVNPGDGEVISEGVGNW
jgi:hypothetical protein